MMNLKTYLEDCDPRLPDGNRVKHTAVPDPRPSRKWTAWLDIDGEIIAAENGDWDTLRDTSEAAIKNAADYLREGIGTEIRVVLYKQLKKDNRPKRDRCVAYLWAENGRVFIDRNRGL